MHPAQYKKRLNRIEAANYCTEKGYATSPATLATKASRGGGPVFSYFGARPVYDPEDLDRWIEDNLSDKVRSTAERPRKQIGDGDEAPNEQGGAEAPEPRTDAPKKAVKNKPRREIAACGA
jgi:hypothetical protein